jgi:voltage-gated potassium channel Kch
MVTTLILVTVLWQWFILLEPVTFLASGGGSPVLNALYFTVITVTTVGYGDITPRSDKGMVLSMMAAFIGVIQIAFLINAIASSQGFNEHEKLALTKIEQS